LGDFRGEVSNRRETVIANFGLPDVGGESMFAVLDELCSSRRDSHSGWTDAVHDVSWCLSYHWGDADEAAAAAALFQSKVADCANDAPV
jgi:hypothetical protein